MARTTFPHDPQSHSGRHDSAAAAATAHTVLPSPDAHAAPNQDLTHFSPGKIRYALLFLFLVNAANFVDRQIVNILAEPIKRDLGLADWQLGVMTGLAFAILYTVLGIPLARYADSPRANRGKLISVCLAFWSVMTAVCGSAQSFAQLLFARMGVATGEAGCSPAAHSLIAEIVPAQKRARALAVFSAGIPAGKLLGLVIGGAVAQSLGWRMAFLVVGVPGVLLAALSWFTLPEPRTVNAMRTTPAVPLRELLRTLAPLRTFWFASLGAAFLAFLSYGQAAFLGSFLIRVHGLNVGEVGLLLGLALGGGGALGSWLGGVAADRGAVRDTRAYMFVPAAGGLIGAALYATAPLVNALPWVIGLLTAATVSTSVWYGPIFAAIQGVVPTRQRATAAAVHFFIINMVGIGFGPLLFGLLSDGLNGGFELFGLHVGGVGAAQGVRYALAIGACAGAIATVFLMIASSAIRGDLLKSK